MLAGTHQREEPLHDGGRWGISVVLRPDPESAARAVAAAGEALAAAGGGHWPTGSAGSLHLTVRALERHRVRVPADDPLAGRAAEALKRAAAGAGPVSFAFTGVTLTPGGVMLCAEPLDGAADAFAASLVRELGEDAWFERSIGLRRNIWYATALHFAGPIPDPAGLVAWVAARREHPLGVVRARSADLVRYQSDGAGAVPVALDSVALDV